MTIVNQQLSFHRFANLFPMMATDEFHGLVADIRSHGIREKIWLYQGQILDGRNRYMACLEADVMPQYREFHGSESDALNAVIAWNLERRHLSSSQKAAVGVELEDLLGELERQAKERQLAQLKQNQKDAVPEIFPERIEPRDQRETRTHIAKAVGTNPRYVQDAKALKQSAPEIHQQVKSGVLSLPQAKQVARLAPEQQQVVLAKVEADPTAVKKVIQSVVIEQSKAEEAKQIAQSPVRKPQIWLSDAVEWLAEQDPYDLLLTDPPYSTDVDDIAAFAQLWLPTALDKLKPTGRAYVCIGAYPQELHAYLSVRMPDQVLVWTYRNTLGPSPNDNYKLNWQAILYYKGKDAPDLNCPVMLEQFSVQDISAPDGRQGDRFHAWQKPLELAERFVRHSTEPGETVADPFACTGTFLIAAAKLGRVGIGSDISEDNLSIAEERGCLIFK